MSGFNLKTDQISRHVLPFHQTLDKNVSKQSIEVKYVERGKFRCEEAQSFGECK